MATAKREYTTGERDNTSVQQRKRIKCSKQQDGRMSEKQCISLLPTSSDSLQSPQWKGWKTLSNELSSPNTVQNNQDFPPLKINIFDSWFTPEPIKNWADFMDEEEFKDDAKLSNTVPKKQRFKRKLLLSETGEKSSSEKKSQPLLLLDEHRLAQRQKQINYGKNTLAYGRYVVDTPRHCRKPADPKTPDKFQICSTRSWSGQIKHWRRKLHEFDPPTEGEVNLFSEDTMSNPMNVMKQDMDMEECGSLTSSNGSEDFFKELNIDTCLLKDPFV